MPSVRRPGKFAKPWKRRPASAAGRCRAIGHNGCVIEPNELDAVEQPGLRPARLGWEVAIVLGISLGQSGIYSILAVIDRLTRNVPLRQQTSTLNASVTPDRPWLDLTYQLVGIAFGLVPVLLALYLLDRSHSPAARSIGFDLRRPRFDVGSGLLIAAAIGIPGLGLYLGARALGLNTQVQASALADHWWTVPVLILAAGQNAVLEEVIVIGYLFTRLGQLGWRLPVVIVGSAVVRGSYHLYQGFGGFAGNLAMGVIFGLIYLRFRRVGPLIVAHTVIDVVAFVGYALVAPHVSWL
jgi:membrane protease YdiL (CAAX protease family)